MTVTTATRAMTGGPMRLIEGKWQVIPGKPMRCPKCGGDEVFHLRDTDKLRVMDCADCGAVGVITKGASSWWYHDWQYPTEMAPAWAAKVLVPV